MFQVMRLQHKPPFRTFDYKMDTMPISPTPTTPLLDAPRRRNPHARIVSPTACIIKGQGPHVTTIAAKTSDKDDAMT